MVAVICWHRSCEDRGERRGRGPIPGASRTALEGTGPLEARLAGGEPGVSRGSGGGAHAPPGGFGASPAGLSLSCPQSRRRAWRPGAGPGPSCRSAARSGPSAICSGSCRRGGRPGPGRIAGLLECGFGPAAALRSGQPPLLLLMVSRFIRNCLAGQADSDADDDLVAPPRRWTFPSHRGSPVIPLPQRPGALAPVKGCRYSDLATTSGKALERE